MRMARVSLATALLALAVAGSTFAAEEVDNPYGEESLIAQPRASKLHDRVTVIVNISMEAKSEAKTDTSKESTLKWSFAKLFRIGKDRDGDIIAKPFADARKPELDVSSEREHKGEGSTESKETVKDMIGATVIDVRPNGHLVIEARRTTLKNNNELVATFTGRVDPKDLSADNAVVLSNIMDANISYKGKGDISSAVKRGWLAKIVDFVSPF